MCKSNALLSLFQQTITKSIPMIFTQKQFTQFKQKHFLGFIFVVQNQFCIFWSLYIYIYIIIYRGLLTLNCTMNVSLFVFAFVLYVHGYDCVFYMLLLDKCVDIVLRISLTEGERERERGGGGGDPDWKMNVMSECHLFASQSGLHISIHQYCWLQLVCNIYVSNLQLVHLVCQTVSRDKDVEVLVKEFGEKILNQPQFVWYSVYSALVMVDTLHGPSDFNL